MLDLVFSFDWLYLGLYQVSLLDLLSLISYCFLVCLLPYLVEQAGDETVCFLDDEIVLSDDEVRAFDDLEGEVLVEDDLHEVGKSVSVLFNFIL